MVHILWKRLFHRERSVARIKLDILPQKITEVDRQHSTFSNFVLKIFFERGEVGTCCMCHLYQVQMKWEVLCWWVSEIHYLFYFIGQVGRIDRQWPHRKIEVLTLWLLAPRHSKSELIIMNQSKLCVSGRCMRNARHKRRPVALAKRLNMYVQHGWLEEHYLVILLKNNLITV